MPEASGHFLEFCKQPEKHLQFAWVAGMHYDFDLGGRSALGTLVRKSKTYGDDPGNIDSAHQLARILINVVSATFTTRYSLESIDSVVHVPAFPPKRPFNLPTILAEDVSKSFSWHNASLSFKKIRETPEAKFGLKEDASSAYVFDGRLKGSNVLIVDDLYSTGQTLNMLAGVLVRAGASRVYGLCATKVVKGMK
jgi:predicted amidophosphoribosyltransferase